METKVAPIINKYWVEDAFPFELTSEPLKELNIAGLGIDGYGCKRASDKLPRTDRAWRWPASTARSPPSLVSRWPCHGHDRARWIRRAEAEVASADGAPREDRLLRPDRAAGRLGRCWRPATTAKRDGDSWTLNGQKKWIGNSPWCDVSIIWARDVATTRSRPSSSRTSRRPASASRRSRTRSRSRWCRTA